MGPAETRESLLEADRMAPPPTPQATKGVEGDAARAGAGCSIPWRE